VEFQYNDKKHSAIGYILFELNFGRCFIKKDLTIEIELLLGTDQLLNQLH